MAAEKQGRRVRVRKTRTNVVTEVTKEILDDLIDEYLRAEKALVAAQEKMQSVAQQASELMDYKTFPKFMNKRGVAELVIPRSNTKVTIDPRKFREVVEDDDEFYSAVTIGSTAAKKVLAEKTLDKISDKVKPDPKDPVMKIRVRTAKDTD